MSDFDNIVDELMNGLWISDNKEYLKFVDAFGRPFYFEAYGDCCSSSWIEHIDGVRVLAHGTALYVEDVYGNEIDSNEHECLQVYFYKFTSTLGYATVELRNSSNGYYGGSIRALNRDPLGDGASHNGAWKRVTEDF